MRLIQASFFILSLLLLNVENSWANANLHNMTIEGQSGGSKDTQGCGFVSENPSYEMDLQRRADYMRLTLQVTGGQPTLLVVGPNPDDSFCVLGDEAAGLKPEISGVWEVGQYQIYVGDRTGSRHSFTLEISTEN